MIDWRENERVGMAWASDQALRHGNVEAVREIPALRPYPDSGPFTIEKADAWRKWAIGWGSLAAYRSDADFYLHAARLAEYTTDDLRAWTRGAPTQ